MLCFTNHLDRNHTNFKLPESDKETEHASRQLQVMLSDLFQFHLSGEQVRRIATKQYGISLSKYKKLLDMLQVPRLSTALARMILLQNANIGTVLDFSFKSFSTMTATASDSRD